MRLNKLGFGALSCAIALAGACNKKGTTNPGGAAASGAAGMTTGTSGTIGGGSGGSTATNTGGSVSTGSGGTKPVTGGATSSTGGTKATAGTSGGTGGTMVTAGTSGGGGTSGGTCSGAGCPTCPGMGAAKTGTCEADANGIYALQVSVDAWWDATMDQTLGTLVEAGRGTVVIYLKGELSGVCKDGSSGVGVMHACGAVLPPFFNDLLCQAYQLEFPDSLWDSPMMPTFMTTGTTTGFNPNDMLMIASATGLVGVDLTDPNGTWPATASAVMCSAGTADKCFPDHDGDMHPGVTVTLNTTGTDMNLSCSAGGNPAFSGAPLGATEALAGISASQLYLGIRNTLAGGGTIGADCKSGAGPAMATTIDSHIIGCYTNQNQACTDLEWQFVDNNSPKYRILNMGDKPGNAGVKDQSASMGPQGKVVRLADPGASVSCADVRNAFK